MNKNWRFYWFFSFKPAMYICRFLHIQNKNIHKKWNKYARPMLYQTYTAEIFFFSKSDEFFFGGSNSPTSMIFKIIICCTDMATLLVGHFRNCFRPTSNPKQCGFSKKNQLSRWFGSKVMKKWGEKWKKSTNLATLL